MEKMKVTVMTALIICLLAACGQSSADNLETENMVQDETDASEIVGTNLEKVDMTTWMYHADDHVYFRNRQW